VPLHSENGGVLSRAKYGALPLPQGFPAHSKCEWQPQDKYLATYLTRPVLKGIYGEWHLHKPREKNKRKDTKSTKYHEDHEDHEEIKLYQVNMRESQFGQRSQELRVKKRLPESQNETNSYAFKL
jgi:hypothetical protein